MYKIYPEKRYNETLKLLHKFASTEDKILDLGVKNPFSDVMEENGYTIINTSGEDLDYHYHNLKNNDVTFVTALEILEHLVNPMEVLRNLPGDKLLATIPMRLWFAPAYRNKNDPRDVHYHEFEDWQFDMLLEKAGWKIIHRHKWTHPTNKIGIRPFLRKITPRYYAVYAERNKDFEFK
ncbi:class I SAM-dependent methyltransferase [Faecalibacter bovis]|uniref:Methyltransferase n=1 Tax=Faecalibacter bovis TaxID=2898187 RepID=A0ABX7XCF2_9FLAO|nr:class I SAM-dependent methyltransferase [Faecalibacter bovis]MBS7333733.1 methyltransferase [Weeksellaceae bacterium]QTV05570.1 methyltransferase [Faecalibacter bovis]